MTEKELKETALTVYTRVSSLKIASQDDFKIAGESLKSIKEVQNKITVYFSDIKKSAYDTWRGICAKETEALKLANEAEKVVRAELNRYATEQARIEAEAQKKLEIEAAAAAEKERAKLLKKGKTEEAEAIYATPVFIEKSDKTVKLDTGSLTKTEDIEIKVINRKEFLKFAIDNLPEAVIDINSANLKAYFKAMKIEACVGLQIIKQSKISVR